MTRRAFPRPAPTTPSPRSGACDWTHAPALVAVGDAAWRVSLRNQSFVVRVARPSGAVSWRLGPDGELTLTSGEW
ncbi:MAG: hypothetical protein EXR73_04175 [Myxococcales bacterium]|nr:hypothetical protein [Myxococcales bacterium]